MEIETILGVDIHDAIMALKWAIENKRLVLNSAPLFKELDKVRLGPKGRVDPATVSSGVRALVRGYISRHPEDWAAR